MTGRSAASAPYPRSTRRFTSSRRSNLTASGAGRPRFVITGDASRSPAAWVQQPPSGSSSRAGRAAAAPGSSTSPSTSASRSRSTSRARSRGARHSRGHLDDCRRAAAGAFTDRASSSAPPGPRRPLGRAAQELIGSLDQGLELAQGTTSSSGRATGSSAAGRSSCALRAPDPRPSSRWSTSSRLSPPRIPLVPAVRSLRTRVAFWLFLRFAFYVLGFFGAWPWRRRGRRPGSLTARRLARARAAPARAIGVVAWLGSGVAPHRLVPRRPVGADEPWRARRLHCSLSPRRRLVARAGNEPVRASLRVARPARLAVWICRRRRRHDVATTSLADARNVAAA